MLANLIYDLFNYHIFCYFCSESLTGVVTIQKNIKFWFVIVLPVYFFIAQNSIQNKHTHFYSNGIVVTHSHPIDSDEEQPVNDHDHTQTEIVFFQQLNFDFYTTPPELRINKRELIVVSKYFIADDNKYKFALLQEPFKRGPPGYFHSV
ncbi:MAG: hypothetical protein ACOCWK_10230 [Tangfeifania sp.]